MGNNKLKLKESTVSKVETNFETEYEISGLSGGVLPLVRPIFTHSKKFIIILTSLELRVYLFATKQCVKSIPLDTQDVTDMYLDDSEKVWVSFKHGIIKIVDLETKSVEREIDVGVPIFSIVKLFSDDRIIATSGYFKLDVKLVDLKKNIETDSYESTVIAEAPRFRHIAFSTNKKYFAISGFIDAGEHIRVGKWDEDFKLEGSLVTIYRGQISSALAISNDGVLAVGSSTGVIDIYHDVFEYGSKFEGTSQALKWHVDHVHSLSFSLDDNYLISGGKERVLVFWQLDSNRSQLLPRLNGTILSITVDPSSELYALHLDNKELVVLSAVDLMSRLQVSGVNAAFVKNVEIKKKRKKALEVAKLPDFTAPHYINPLTGHSYIPTKENSSIQIFDPSQDEQISTFAVAPTMQMGRVKSERAIEDPQIKKVAFTHDGKWMATVDEYFPPTTEDLLSSKDKQVELKFWKYIPSDGTWALTTKVSFPHGIGKSILSIEPACSSYYNGHAFLTCCENGGVRLWRPETIKSLQTPKELQQRKTKAERQISWSVRKVLPPLATISSTAFISLSPDGSMIVLGFESTLYVIDFSSFEIVKILPNILGSRIRWLKIVGSHLVVLAKSRLAVYDLVNNTINWSLKVLTNSNGGRLIDADPVTGNIAFAINSLKIPEYEYQSRIFIFSTSSPVPIFTSTHTTAISNVKHVPGSTASRFRLLDGHSRLVTIKPSDDKTDVATVHSENIDSFEASIRALYTRQEPRRAVKAVDFDFANEHITTEAFDNVFEDSELGVSSMEVLFDRVLGVLSGEVAAK